MTDNIEVTYPNPGWAKEKAKEQKTIKVLVRITSVLDYELEIEADDIDEAIVTAEEAIHSDEDLAGYLLDEMVVTSIEEVVDE